MYTSIPSEYLSGSASVTNKKYVVETGSAVYDISTWILTILPAALKFYIGCDNSCQIVRAFLSTLKERGHFYV